MRIWFEREGLIMLWIDHVRVFLPRNEKKGSNAISRSTGRRVRAMKHDQTAIHDLEVGVLIKLQVM